MVDANLEVKGFDARTGAKRFHRILGGRQTFPWGVPWLTEDGAIALVRLPDGKAAAWEVATEKRLATIDHLYSFDRSRLVVVRRPGGPFELVDVETGQKRALRGTESAEFLVLAPTAQNLAIVRKPDELAIWDLATDQPRRRRQGIQTGWSAATISHDATILAAGALSGLIQLWDVTTLELLDTLPGHSDLIFDLDFSPDGKVLASVSADGVVKLWDVAARSELLTLRGGFRPWSSLRFSPDGRTLAFRADTEGKGTIYLISTALPEGLTAEEGP
jgi:WD40 repeat protein